MGWYFLFFNFFFFYYRVKIPNKHDRHDFNEVFCVWIEFVHPLWATPYTKLEFSSFFPFSISSLYFQNEFEDDFPTQTICRINANTILQYRERILRTCFSLTGLSMLLTALLMLAAYKKKIQMPLVKEKIHRVIIDSLLEHRYLKFFKIFTFQFQTSLALV